MDIDNLYGRWASFPPARLFSAKWQNWPQRHNTIVAARAGKDLVSSLISGLATIGPAHSGPEQSMDIPFPVRARVFCGLGTKVLASGVPLMTRHACLPLPWTVVSRPPSLWRSVARLGDEQDVSSCTSVGMRRHLVPPCADSRAAYRSIALKSQQAVAGRQEVASTSGERRGCQVILIPLRQHER